MGKVLKSVAVAAAIVGLAVVTGGVSLVPTFTAGSFVSITAAGAAMLTMAATTVLSGIAQQLFGPKAPRTQLSRLNVSLDPIAPRKAVFGTTAMNLDLRYHEASGTNQEYIDYIIAVAAHKVTAISEIWFEEKQAWTAAGGVTPTYSGYLTVNTRTEGTSANTISINGGAKWGSSRRLTGCAYLHLRIKRTGTTNKVESPLVNGLPSRVTVVGNGALLYDPRKDSTVTGGSGSHRANDQTTWGAYTDPDDCDNPALQLLWWLLGWKINGKLSIGCGVPANRIDMASFITAANLCDENVTLAIGGTQKRYRTSGTASDADNRMDIINTFLMSMNGTLRDNAGKLTLTVMNNDLANYVLDFNEADMLGEFDWQQTRGLTESYNIARGRYVDPSNNSLYQMVDYPEVSLTSPDGIERATTIDLAYVEDGRRAQRIAKQILQRNQYRGMFSATFNAKALGCQVGDVVRLSIEVMGWSNKLFRVISQEIRFDGQVPLALVEENAAIYSWVNEDVAPISPTAPTVYDPLNSPFILGIDDALIAAADAQSTADGKIDSYYQTTPPTGASEGDYWTDTDDANKLYRYTSGSWVLIRDTGIPTAIAAAAGAQATADGKITTYYSETAPTATAIGDLWCKPSTRLVQRWNGSAWADVATIGAQTGTNLYRTDGTTVLTQAEVLTVEGTAAAITGQGTLATKDGVAWATEVSGRDAFLTDGRIPTGLDSVGRNQVGINAGTGNAFSNTDILGTVNGTNIALNPEFLDGTTTGWNGYDNSGGGKVLISLVSEATAPNASGNILRISYDGTGTPNSNPTPGYGGAVQFINDALNATGNSRSAPGFYSRGTTIIYSILAKIPVGYNIEFASNNFGSDGSFFWMTSTAGTGGWQRYIGRQIIGTTGTFSSTAYLYAVNGPNAAFTWDIAKFDQIDITSANRTFLGTGGLTRQTGVAVSDSDAITALGTSAAIAGQGTLATKSSVITTDIAANAVTSGSSAFGDSSIDLTTSWQTMASCTVTMTGGAARVDFCALVNGQADSSGCPVNIRLLRNGSSIRETNLTILPGEQTVYTGDFGEYSVLIKTPVTGSFPMFLVDTSGATGSVEYVVQLKLGNANADYATAAHRQIVATEFRR